MDKPAQLQLMVKADLEHGAGGAQGGCGDACLQQPAGFSSLLPACQHAQLGSETHKADLAQVVPTEDVETGFSNLVANLEDLQLDVPEAVDLLARFILRAVTDEVLPPAFVKTIPGGELRKPDSNLAVLGLM